LQEPRFVIYSSRVKTEAWSFDPPIHQGGVGQGLGELSKKAIPDARAKIYLPL
jgi:hypothetical protein